MRYGIYDLKNADWESYIVKCNNCGLYFYEMVDDERNDNALVILTDTETGEFYRGCPVCETDGYLQNEN